MALKKTDAEFDTPQQVVDHIREVGQIMHEHGIPVGKYLCNIDAGVIASQRATKDSFASKLRAADTSPQIVTVQGRNGQKDMTYVIVVADKFTETIDAAASGRNNFVPITVRMREIGGDAVLPIPKPAKRSRPLRSRKGKMPSRETAGSRA